MPQNVDIVGQQYIAINIVNVCYQANTMLPYNCYHINPTIQMPPYKYYHTYSTVQILADKCYHTNATIHILPYKCYYQMLPYKCNLKNATTNKYENTTLTSYGQSISSLARFLMVGKL